MARAKVTFFLCKLNKFGFCITSSSIKNVMPSVLIIEQNRLLVSIFDYVDLFLAYFHVKSFTTHAMRIAAETESNRNP